MWIEMCENKEDTYFTLGLVCLWAVLFSTTSHFTNDPLSSLAVRWLCDSQPSQHYILTPHFGFCLSPRAKLKRGHPGQAYNLAPRQTDILWIFFYWNWVSVNKSNWCSVAPYTLVPWAAARLAHPLIQPCSHLALGWALSKEIKFLLKWTRHFLER
jgi:hypothetical protein